MKVFVVVESQDCTTGAMRYRVVKVWLCQRNGRVEWRMMLFLTFRRREDLPTFTGCQNGQQVMSRLTFVRIQQVLGYVDDVDVAIPR